MPKQYSIADARKRLSELVDAVEAGTEVRLTRRGLPVAVVLSVREYERLSQEPPSFAASFKAFRERFPEPSTGLAKSYWTKLRDRSRGRKVEL